MPRRLVWEDYTGTGQTKQEFRAHKESIRRNSGAALRSLRKALSRPQTYHYQPWYTRRRVMSTPITYAEHAALERRALAMARGSYRSYGGSNLLTRAKRVAIARKRQRQLRAAGRRLLGVTSYGARSGETKYVDGYLDYTTITELTANDQTWAGCELNPRQQTAVYGCLPMPKQGTGYSERDGRKIFIKKIIIRGNISYSAEDSTTAPQAIPYIRLIVVKDTRCPGAELNAEDVINPGTGSDGNASLTSDCQVMCGTNPNGWGRFKILKDKVFRAPILSAWGDNTNAGNINGMTIPFTLTVKPMCYVNFDASTGAVGSIVDNAFHLIGACSSTALTQSPRISYTARTVFTG